MYITLSYYKENSAYSEACAICFLVRKIMFSFSVNIMQMYRKNRIFAHKMEKKEISVVINTYNAEKFLQRVLDSV